MINGINGSEVSVFLALQSTHQSFVLLLLQAPGYLATNVDARWCAKAVTALLNSCPRIVSA